MLEYGKGNLEKIILDMCHRAGAKIYNFDEMIDNGSFADYNVDLTDKVDYDPINVLNDKLNTNNEFITNVHK